ncbi:hypothetical protein P9D51_03870 [Bacillus sonorensis]|uniref:hypothetical protein n=1 Tax=Bacillus sonorensis TaxID=119858 RepID=UPI002DBB8722|nr:hypothetical protein [Bacillus sonorensis]MEC1354565.1 hypothetical protein [Bacillus sonorensis]MEC1425281.1 hypothetical protein [Bacillus sonorensis]
MQNKAANRLTLLGIGLHIMYWFGILFVFLRIKSRWFDSYTVWNPDVVSGYTQSETFVDMLRSMIYSGTLFNWFCFFLLIMLIVILFGAVAYFYCPGNYGVFQNQKKSFFCVGFFYFGDGF